jgi:hypothetical protein
MRAKIDVIKRPNGRRIVLEDTAGNAWAAVKHGNAWAAHVVRHKQCCMGALQAATLLQLLTVVAQKGPRFPF